MGSSGINAKGYSIHSYDPVDSGDFSKVCVLLTDLAKAWVHVENGTDTRFVVSNNYTDWIAPMGRGVSKIDDDSIVFGDLVFHPDPDCGLPAFDVDDGDGRRRLDPLEARRSLREHIRELRHGKPHIHGRRLFPDG